MTRTTDIASAAGRKGTRGARALLAGAAVGLVYDKLSYRPWEVLTNVPPSASQTAPVRQEVTEAGITLVRPGA